MPKKLRLAKDLPADGENLCWNETRGLWEPGDCAGGGLTTCAGITEHDGDVWVYDATGSCWRPKHPKAIGVDEPDDPPPIDPPDIADLILWYKPESLVQFGDGGTVTEWIDSSGNASDLDTYISTESYVAVANAIDGWYAIDGEDQGTPSLRVQLTSSAPPTGLKGLVGFSVLQKDNWNSTYGALMCDSSYLSIPRGMFFGDYSSISSVSNSLGTSRFEMRSEDWADNAADGEWTLVIWIGIAWEWNSGTPNYYHAFTSAAIGDIGGPEPGWWSYRWYYGATTVNPSFKLDNMGDYAGSFDLRGDVAEILVYGTQDLAEDIEPSPSFPGMADVHDLVNGYFRDKYPTVVRDRIPTMKRDTYEYKASEYGDLVCHIETPHCYSKGIGAIQAPLYCKFIEYDSTNANLDAGVRFGDATGQSAVSAEVSGVKWSHQQYWVNGFAPMHCNTTQAIMATLADWSAFSASGEGFTMIAILKTAPGILHNRQCWLAYTNTSTVRRIYLVWGNSGMNCYIYYSGSAQDIAHYSNFKNEFNTGGGNIVVLRRGTGNYWSLYCNGADVSSSPKKTETNSWYFSNFFYAPASQDTAWHPLGIMIYQEALTNDNLNRLCNKISDKYDLGQTWSVS